ncbi:MAG: cytochrome c [Neolewinella sp.]|jgi:cytochrome c
MVCYPFCVSYFFIIHVRRKNNRHSKAAPEEIQLQRWYYQPTANYGGPKLAETSLPISRMVWSADRKKLWVNFDGLKPEHVYYLRLPNTYWLSH